MKHIAIIADDLTGASDSGVQFARKGLQTQVIFDVLQIANQAHVTEAVVVDTDSRSVAAEIAYANVKEAAQQVKEAGFSYVYKKMDSTLRGNLGTEIDAVMDVMSFDFAVVAPAFPKIGRTTAQGVHYLNGVPVSQTEIANDPKCPVRQSDLVQLFAAQSKRQVGLIPLAVLHAGKEHVLKSIQALLEAKNELIVFDAVTEEDLQLIVEWISASSYKPLWAGSAGMADYLPEALALPVNTTVPIQLPPVTKPVMLVAGSISKVTRHQVATYNLDPTVAAIEMNTVVAIATDEGAQQEIGRCKQALLTAIEAGHDVSLFASSSPEQVASTKEAGAARGLDGNGVSNQIANLLGAIASDVMQRTALQGVILTGGDTAKAVCRNLGVPSIQLVRELEPGIPLGLMVKEVPVQVVTKAGAFGQEHSLSHAKNVLKGE